MSPLHRTPRPRPTRRRPLVERLESRRLYAVWPETGAVGLDSLATASLSFAAAAGGTTPTASGETLSVVQTTPAAGAVLTQSPTSLTIRFDRPFNPASVYQDIELEQVANDGKVTQVIPVNEPTDLVAPTDTLVVSLGAFLPAGHYRIVLLHNATLQGADGEPLDNQGADGEPGVDEALGDFTVRPQSISLAGATDLGTIGSTPTVAPGTLGSQDNPPAVQFYRFTLAPGHHWRFGAEISAGRDGGTLSTELALFDARGNLLATGDVGRPDAPFDPFLFAGLAPGTYYIGVSDSDNIPGQSGGYDPISGDPGNSNLAQAGGPFRIHLAATPADAPTQLLSFNLNWADPNDQSPTGMTLVFSGPLSLDSLLGRVEGQGQGVQGIDSVVSHFTALQIVDQTGKAWPLTVTDYQEAEGRLTFAFDEKLPAGQYTLRIPAQGGITDLAGWTPVAPGEPAGVLASWTVQPERTAPDPHDLGALYRSVHDGIPGWDLIAPGSSTTYRFVVAVPGLYSFETQSRGGPLEVQLTGPDGIQSFDGGAPGQANWVHINLTPGVYYMKLVATGSQPVDVDWVLQMQSGGWDSPLGNGLAQGPALNLLFINLGASGSPSTPSTPSTPGAPSAPSTPGVAPSTTPAPGPQPMLSAASATAPIAPSSPSGSSGSQGAASASAGSAGLVLTLAGFPVGAPLAQTSHLAVVGPATAASGGPALAVHSAGLLQGINYGQGAPTGEPGVAIVNADPPAAVDAHAEPIDGAMVLEGRPVADNPDERSLAATDWFGRIGAAVLDWFAPAPHADPALVAAAKAERLAMMTDELAPETEEIQEAHIAGPLGLAAASALVMRFRRPLRRWLERRKKKVAGARTSPHHPIVRPHRRRSRRPSHWTSRA
jgi:methionine-rich copper-binding protein CopC